MRLANKLFIELELTMGSLATVPACEWKMRLLISDKEKARQGGLAGFSGALNRVSLSRTKRFDLS